MKTRKTGINHAASQPLTWGADGGAGDGAGGTSAIWMRRHLWDGKLVSCHRQIISFRLQNTTQIAAPNPENWKREPRLWNNSFPRGQIRFACLMRRRLILSHSPRRILRWEALILILLPTDLRNRKTAMEMELETETETEPHRQSREMQMQVDSGSWRGIPNLARRVK